MEPYAAVTIQVFFDCTVTLWNLITLSKQNIFPKKIDFSRVFTGFKTSEQNQDQVDVYPLYFSLCNSEEIKPKRFWICRVNHHFPYRLVDFDFYNQLIAKYFSLSQPVLEVLDSLVKKYNVNPSKTIAVFYRGTDKHIECTLADPDLYLNQAEKILKRHPDFRILIQTDQKQVRDLFVSYFGDRCFFFEEMPVTESQTVLHHMDSKTLGMNKFEFGKTVLAVTYLISHCQFVVNHTGNMALWVCLFRGNTKNVVQINAIGEVDTNLSLIKYIFYRLINKLNKLNRVLRGCT